MGRGLEYLHARIPVILHRDIKPANMMLTLGHEHVKLCDFGVSTTIRDAPSPEARGIRSIGEAAADGPAARGAGGDKKEMTGKTGTYRYMAPEVRAPGRMQAARDRRRRNSIVASDQRRPYIIVGAS